MPVRHLFRDLQLALKLSGTNPAVPATGVVAGLLFGAMKRGWAANDSAILSRAFEPDLPPAPVVPKTEPVAIRTPAATEEPAPEEVQLMATTEGPVELVADPAAETATEAEPPVVALPAIANTTPTRGGMIPETHGGRGSKLRAGLELLHTTPVIVGGPLKPTTTPPTPATTPPAPIAPPPSILPARASAPPSPPSKSRPAQTSGVPLPPFPAAPPESPHFPVNMPHRVNRRLSDTTNLQGLLQSEMDTGKVRLAGALPGPSPARAPLEARGEEPAKVEAEEAPLEAITAEVLPPLPATPAIAPVIPGDIRPSQRIPLRAVDPDAQPRPRLIRDPKTKSWIHRLIGG